MHHIKAVLFDFDNTLIDSVRQDIMAVEQVCKALPKEVDPELFVEVAIAKIMTFNQKVDRGEAQGKDVYQYRFYHTLKHFDIPWDEKYLDVFMDYHLNHIYVYPGAQEVLKSLSSHLKTGLLTNAYIAKDQMQRIACSGLGTYFDEVVVCSEIGYYKPAAEAFWFMANKLGTDPYNCIYIGDSEKHDIKGAKSAGMRSVRLVHQAGVDISSLSTDADYMCRNLTELKSLLIKIVT